MMKRGTAGAAFLRVAMVAAACRCACAEEAKGAEAAAAATNQIVVLDTGGFWRFHLTLRDALFGKPDAARPRDRKPGDLQHLSDLPPPDWMKPEFDDGAWGRAPAPFYGGYGFQQPDTIALICLRGKFAVDDPAKVPSLTFNAAFRGGLIAYVNGKEVSRSHLPEGALTQETLAEGYPLEDYISPSNKVIRWGWGDPGKYRDRCEARIRRVADVAVPAKLLRKGMNVLAIEVHRAPYPEGYFSTPNWWDGFRCHAGLLSAQLRSGPAEGIVAGVTRPRGVQVWNANPMMAIFDMDYGDPVEQLNPIRVTGARNGAFSGQVVVSSDTAIKGLAATAGDLKLKGGGAVIPAAALQVRYAQPGGFENGSDARYRTGEVRRFDPLAEVPPAEVPVYAKTRGRAPFGAVQPVWVTVSVPADAAPGEYQGALTIRAEGQQDVVVPVEAQVAAWNLPEPTNCVTFVDMIESPESVALYYDVPLWSDRHWALMDRTFLHLGRAGNTTVYIPLICKTHFGNEQGMVRVVKQPDGTFKGDFTVMERYLDMATRRLGRPRVVCFYMWDHFAGGGYFSSKTDPAKWSKIPVSLLDPATGSVTELEAPSYADPAAETFWKPIADELVERMKKRGLEGSMMVGICSDVRAAKEVVDLWKKLMPGAKWVIHSHGLEGQLYGVPVGYSSTVWKTEFPRDPDAGRAYGWARNAWNRKNMGYVTMFHRDLAFGYQLTQNRLLPENNIGGGQCGFGRNGADFWPGLKNDKGQKVRSLPGRYPQSNWSQLSVKTCFLAPGPDGALSTVRFEMTREGVQECEARISIEKALMDKAQREKLGEETAKRLQDLLDERIRAGLWGWGNYDWYVSSGWQARSAKLYAAAAEVAAKLAATK
jgi:hypothetical protein